MLPGMSRIATCTAEARLGREKYEFGTLGQPIRTGRVADHVHSPARGVDQQPGYGQGNRGRESPPRRSARRYERPLRRGEPQAGSDRRERSMRRAARSQCSKSARLLSRGAGEALENLRLLLEASSPEFRDKGTFDGQPPG